MKLNVHWFTSMMSGRPNKLERLPNRTLQVIINRACFGVLAALILLMTIGQGLAHNHTITGYEYLDNNQTLHVWNNGSTEPNYYYENECLDQISNQYPRNNTWEHTKKSVRYHDGGQWFDLPITNCERTDNTDNLTYTNNSASIRFGSPGHHVDLGTQSRLGVNDDLITQEFWGQPNFKIGDDVHFRMTSYNLSVGGDSDNDVVLIQNRYTNDTWIFNLSVIKNLNMTYTLNGTDFYPYYFIADQTLSASILHEYFNTSYDWNLTIDGNVTLSVNMGSFDRDEYKSFVKRWVDAGCVCEGFNLRAEADSSYPNGTTFSVGEDFVFECKVTLQSFGGGCTGCAIEWRDNQYGNQYIRVNPNSTDVLDCDVGPAICIQKIVLYNVFQEIDMSCNVAGEVGTWCVHEDHTGFISNTPSTTTDVTCETVGKGFRRSESWGWALIPIFVILFSMWLVYNYYGMKNKKEREDDGERK